MTKKETENNARLQKQEERHADDFSSSAAAKKPLNEQPIRITKSDGTKKEIPTLIIRPMEDPKKAEELRNTARKVLEELGLEGKPKEHKGVEKDGKTKIVEEDDDDGGYLY